MDFGPRTVSQAVSKIAAAANFKEAIDVVGGAPVLVPYQRDGNDSIKVSVTPDIDCVITAGQPQGMGQGTHYTLVDFHTPKGAKLDYAYAMQALAGQNPAEFAALVAAASAAVK